MNAGSMRFTKSHKIILLQIGASKCFFIKKIQFGQSNSTFCL
jgi:hypothetical protein